MDGTSIVQAISSVGFPIVAFLLMFWYIKTEMKELSQVIQSNTNALTALLEHMHEKEDDK